MDFLKSKSLVSFDYLMAHNESQKELIVIYDNAKSFYGKARIYELDGIIYLVSYSTIVAKVYKNYAQIFGWYSQTTGRHINEFLLQNGFKKLTKKQIESNSNTYGLIIKK